MLVKFDAPRGTAATPVRIEITIVFTPRCSRRNGGTSRAIGRLGQPGLVLSGNPCESGVIPRRLCPVGRRSPSSGPTSEWLRQRQPRPDEVIPRGAPPISVVPLVDACGL